jgi:hypothetical protein
LLTYRLDFLLTHMNRRRNCHLRLHLSVEIESTSERAGRKCRLLISSSLVLTVRSKALPEVLLSHISFKKAPRKENTKANPANSNGSMPASSKSIM